MKSTRTRPLPAVTPNTFTAAVDHGWTMMARMCAEQLRIIKATSAVHVCTNFYRHQSIKSVFFHSVATERSAPLKTPPGQVGVKDPAALWLCPFRLYGTNIFLPLGPTFLVFWSKVYVLGALWRLALSPSPREPIHAAGMQRKPLMEREQQDTANIWIQQTEKLHRLCSVSFEEKKKSLVGKEKGSRSSW